MVWQTRGTLSLLLLLALGACETPRVHRLTDFEYTSRPADARVDLFDIEIESDYDPIAIIDSERYFMRDYAPDAKESIAQARHNASRAEHDAATAQMREDLMREARALGGDAVHKIRMLSDQVRGFMPDPRAPIPGVVQQGYRDAYFFRGEVIKYLDLSPATPGKKTEVKK